MNWLLEILKAILFGVVEGISEWLPISSTGHMILLEDFLKVNTLFSKDGFPDYGSAFWSMFLVVIQLGAIIAVILFFWHRLWPFSRTKTSGEKKETWLLWAKVLVAAIPAGIIGILFDDKLNEIFYNSLTVSITLIVYGVFFIVIEGWNKKRSFSILSTSTMNFRTAAIIGLFQVLALIPGTSRSGITILGAMLIGCDRSTSAEFSFFLSIPVMVGASLYKIARFVIHYGMPGSREVVFLLVGCLVAFAVSLLVVKWLMAFLKKHTFHGFGYYRIALGLVVLAYFIFGLFNAAK